MRAVCWLVLSPTYRERDEPDGPIYPANDLLSVFARTRQRAMILALRAWRRKYGGRRVLRDYLWAGENPFKGMTCERRLLLLPHDDVSAARCRRLARKRPAA